MPFFSIIIPSFNSASYIDATLASIAAQTFADFEVVVVDDGSSDASVQLCNEAFRKYDLKGQIILRPADRVKGVASCRNLGVELAKAEWVCFLDSDDLFLPGKLEATKKCIDEYGDTCSAYHHGARNFDDLTGETLLFVSQDLTREPADILPRMVSWNLVITSTATVRKKLLLSLGGFNTALHGVEDYMMWLLVAKSTKWSYLKEPLTDYRVRSASLMGGREMKHYVSQNAALLSQVKTSGKFSNEEIYSIDKYFFDALMPYYSMESLRNRGWKDFCSGLLVLSRSGKSRLALHLFYKFSKRQVLSELVKLKP